ncbi:hypothetical protein N0V93_009000 [Gnomoniopsis smithogilvyi]|uniref:Uncharacterized protein n=1 Tax=Gnomoniopsis smithogilvyi TaxID=1191159 RepID=A0A9W8YK04_9PEZI|nr:hypothetical protein N0V93_009000 [Gnomoniopsis smithogilvyi]
MLRSLILLSCLTQAGLGNPLPKAGSVSCSTTTSEVIIPTTTVTYTTTPISTIYASTAEDLGTFTNIVRIPSTSTVATVTSTATACQGSGSLAATGLATLYTTAGTASPASAKRDILVANQRDVAAECVVTTTFTTSVGQTYVFVPGTSTKLYTQYTAFSQATITVTSYTGTAYVVASEAATVTPAADACVTVVRDARCDPSLMVAAAGGTNNAQYGLISKSDVPTSGPKMDNICSGSAWDVRTNSCFLEFAVNPVDGELNCGESLLAYYDAGPISPMAAGAGWWVANICGSAEYGSAEPDDGT